jgi:hypothetical protein
MDSLSFTLHELEAHGSTRSYNALMTPAEGVLDSLSFPPHFAAASACWCKNITGDMTTLTTASDEFVHG